MKAKVLVLFIMLLGGLTLAQTEYPLVTIQDIQRVPDSLAGTDPVSPLNGDTVKVRGVVMVSPFIHPDTARRNIIVAGSRWVTYVQDPNGELWGGLNILQENVDEVGANTFFDLVDTAQVVEFTGRVVEYNTTTEILLIDKPVAIPVDIIETLPKRPDPIQLELADLFTAEGTYNFDAEKYEGMLVEFKNVITSDRESNGEFKINDGNGHSAFIYNQSRYFKTGTSGEVGWNAPNDGTYLSYVRGIVTTRTDGYYIVPVYPGDVGEQLVAPPTIANIKRDIIEVTPNQPVTVSAKITDFDGSVAEAKIFYTINSGAIDSILMTSVDTIFTGTIPGASANDIVDFCVIAKDDQGNQSISPSDTSKQNYYYFVLDRPLTIKDIQYNPWGGNYTAYHGYKVTVSGIVTSDTTGQSNRTGTATNRIMMQYGEGPWSGLWLNAINTAQDIYALKAGDNITVTGVMTEDFNFTKMDSISALVITSSGNTLPEPTLLSTGEIGKKLLADTTVERWESVLIKYENVKVTDLNADGEPGPQTNNYGEIFINDGTGDTRVELQEGNTFFHNNWEGVATNPSFTAINDTGSTFESVTGYLSYTFYNYKIIPRFYSDLQGFEGPSSVEIVNNQPASFAVSQNYPNPFNPSTTISYSLPKEGMVTVKVFNIIGQEVATLVNTQQSAGTYKVIFDSSSLSTGVYFYSVRAGNFSQVKKMMLIK